MLKQNDVLPEHRLESYPDGHARIDHFYLEKGRTLNNFLLILGFCTMHVSSLLLVFLIQKDSGNEHKNVDAERPVFEAPTRRNTGTPFGPELDKPASS